MDQLGELNKMRGRLGGLTRALKKAEQERDKLASATNKAMEIVEGQCRICAVMAGTKCEECLAGDDCWQFEVVKILSSVSSK